MKKLIYLSLLFSLIFLTCNESVVQEPLPAGSLLLDSKPEGASIYIQGTFENQTPSTIKNMAPGNYDVRIEVEPGVDSSFVTEVKYVLNNSKTIDFENKMGKCLFQSTPSGAEIFLDGINSNKKTPALLTYLMTGMHSYKLQLNGDIVQDNFFISPGELKNIDCDFNSLNSEGSIFISSSPEGAQIWIAYQNSGKVTPDIVTNLIPGQYPITLKLNEYRDTSFTAIVMAGLQTMEYISLTPALSVTAYGPVRLFESSGTSTGQPSGLDLSSGNAYSLSGADRDKIDIYYSTDGTGGTPYLLQSSDLFPGLIRQTYFIVGGGYNIIDGVASPAFPFGGWSNNMDDREDNYVFLYDEDGHYSKLIITNYGGGTVGDPSWVEVKWIYNNTASDTRF